MTKTYTQAELDAAVAAALEKAAGQCVSRKDRHWDNYTATVIEGRIRALIPTDALAEHDAKVRADALREAATICAECEETFERREANGAAHGAAMCFKAIRALIEGEA